MADNEDGDIDGEGDGLEDELEGGGKKKSKKKLLFILLPVLLLGGGGAAFMMGMLDPLLGKEKHAEAEAAHEEAKPAAPPVYYELPQMLVNLNSSGKRSNFLKIVVSLEVKGPEDVAKVEEAMPRIVDNFQVYLRELRVEDLRGSAGIYRLREELLFRVNAAANPAHVSDVLFKEMLVQ